MRGLNSEDVCDSYDVERDHIRSWPQEFTVQAMNFSPLLEPYKDARTI